VALRSLLGREGRDRRQEGEYWPGRSSDTKFIQARYAIQILCKVPRAGGQLTAARYRPGPAFVICSNFASIYTAAADTRPEK